MRTSGHDSASPNQILEQTGERNQVSSTEPCSEGVRGDEGFLLVGAIVLVFLVVLALTIAAPQIAMSLKRDREIEATHRANQYVRAIQLYYKKFQHYPGSLEQLEKTNNQRFLRQQYLDPLTGKSDWRVIHVGENKTTVKGCLGSAAGMTSPTSGTGSAFSNSPGSGNGGIGGSTGGPQSPGGRSPGSGPIGGGTDSGSSASSIGISSQSASGFKGTGGPIMGIGTSRSGSATVTVNGVSTYEEWEFLYDPRIETLKAKGSLLGGLSSGAPSKSGLGQLGFGDGGATGSPTPSPTTPPR
jgi:type II secretory pathway pseudopilin PulG